MNKKLEALLNPLLAFLRVRVPGSTEPSLMSHNQPANHLVLPHVADSLLVPFGRPWPRVELWPVDLLTLVSHLDRTEGEEGLTYNIPFLRMKFAHQAATANQNRMKILTGKTAASGNLLVKDPMNTKNKLKAKT
jgi:hypothetical protein